MVDGCGDVGLTSAVQKLAAAELWRLGDEELLNLVRLVETQTRRLFAASLRLVAEVDDRGLGASVGACSTAALLRQMLNVTPAEAVGRVGLAETLVGRPSPSGQPIPPVHPATAAALADGSIDAAQARVIGATLRRLPAGIDMETRARAERFMAAQARDYDATLLGRIARRMTATLDPDGTLAAEREAVTYRELHFGRDSDGMLTVHGRLDAEAGAVLRTAIDPLAGPVPATADGPDPRSPARRTADALVELARRALQTGELPEQGGQRPQLTVTVTLDDLRAKIGAGLLDWGEPVTAHTVRRIACDAHLIPVLLNTAGQPLDVGRASHTIPTGIRRALVARDRGCAFPGCDRPPAWCDGHHIEHWADGGPTAITNLVLLCGHHHRTIHQHDWQVRIVGGNPEFVPPPWIDPAGTPRRNHIHHLPTLPEPPDPTGATDPSPPPGRRGQPATPELVTIS